MPILCGLGGRHVGEIAAAGVGVVGDAVDLIFVDAGLTAVDGEVGDGTVVEGARVEQATGVGDAGAEIINVKGLWPSSGRVEISSEPTTWGADDLAAAAGGFLEQRGLGGDGDLLGDAAYFERDIDAGTVVDVEFDGRAAVGLEACVGDLERVDAGEQVGTW